MTGEQHEESAKDELHQGQHGGACWIIVEAERLIDADFEGRGRRPAAQGEHDRKARGTNEEDQTRYAGKAAFDLGPFDEAESRHGGEVELCREPEAFGRDAVELLQNEPGCERQVEEDMRQENAGQPIDVERLAKEAAQPAGAAIDGDNAKDDDDGRQRQRQSEEAEQEAAAQEVDARQSERHGKGKRHGEQGRKSGLQQGEPQDAQHIGIDHMADDEAFADADRRHGRKADRDGEHDDRERQARGQRRSISNFPPLPQAGDEKRKRVIYHLLMAFSHSSIQARRCSATSSGVNKKVLSGLTSWSNVGAKGVDVLPAGNIQLFSGMASWNPGSSMKLRNFRASAFSGELAMMPATSICK